MNEPSPTQATKYVGDKKESFTRGAGMSVNNSGKASGNRPATIAERKKNSFRGSEQPIRKFGPKYKFLDESVNHPAIPKSSLTAFTQEIDESDLPKRHSGNASQIRTLDNDGS